MIVICRGWILSRVLVLLYLFTLISLFLVSALSIIDGYAFRGTYGPLVFIGIVASIIAIFQSKLIFAYHLFKCSPVLYVQNGRFNFIAPGRKSIALSDVKSVGVERRGFYNFKFLVYLDELQNEVGCHPLTLAYESPSTILERAERVIH